MLGRTSEICRDGHDADDGDDDGDDGDAEADAAEGPTEVLPVTPEIQLKHIGRPVNKAQNRRKTWVR